MEFQRSWDGIYAKPDNLVELFENAVVKFADNKFLGTKNKSGIYEWITYRQAGERVDAVRAGLASLGVGKNDAVGIIAANRVEWAVLAFATYGLAARFVPMYEKELTSVWRYIVKDAAIKVLIVSTAEIFENLKNLPQEIPTLEHVILLEGTGDKSFTALESRGRHNPVLAVHPSCNDTAVLIYTSGTTGDPKGALLSHGNCTSNCRAGWHLFQELQADAISFSHLPWAHSYGFCAELNNWVQFGGAIAFMDTMDTLAEDMVRAAPTYLISVPRVFNKIHEKIMTTIREEGGWKLKLFNMAIGAALTKHRSGKSSLKYRILDKIVLKKIRARFGGRLQGALTASARMNPEIAEFFFAIGIPVYDCYGMTETSPAVTMSHSTRYRPGSVGKTLENVDIVIDKSKVADGSDEGEIIIYGPNVMQGYHNKPEMTAPIMTLDGGIRSGDRGRLDKDGFLYITGRFKEEYKLTNGKYVFPAAIEEDIMLLPYINNVLVYGDNQPYNVALIVPNRQAIEDLAREANIRKDKSDFLNPSAVEELITQKIAEHLRNKFGGYEIPKKIAFVEEEFTIDNAMITQTMKLKRRLIILRFKNLIDELYSAD